MKIISKMRHCGNRVLAVEPHEYYKLKVTVVPFVPYDVRNDFIAYRCRTKFAIYCRFLFEPVRMIAYNYRF